MIFHLEEINKFYSRKNQQIIKSLKMLIIKNLHASVEDKEILKGINLEVKAGEVHAIMGPNGAGKSTLSSVIAGNENFEVTEGDILLQGESLLKKIREKAALLEINPDFLSRSLNQGFSGGEKKRNEIFQMAMLEPKVAILDETDSGLDIDALRIVANGVNKLKSENNAVIVITHYQRLLDYIVPDFVHVLHNGKIVKSGTKELALELEHKGYDWLK